MNPGQLLGVGVLSNFLEKLTALFSAVARCWVLLAIAGAASATLLRTGQGIESVVADLRSPWLTAGGGFLFVGAAVLVALIFLSSSWTLGHWRTGMDDPSTTYARYTVPVLVSLLGVCVEPVLIIGAKGIAPAEAAVMARAEGILVAETIFIAMYLRFGISGAAANRPAVDLFTRIAARLPKEYPSTRLIHTIVFGLTGLRRYRVVQAVESYVLSLLNVGFIVCAMMFVAAQHTGLIEDEVIEELGLTGSASEVSPIWALTLELMGALIAALLLGISWLALSWTSIRLFAVGALVIVAAVDWQVAQRVSPQLVAPARKKQMSSRFLSFTVLVVVIGVSVFLGDLPQVSIGRLGAPFVLLVAIAFWVAVWTLVNMATLRGGWMRAVALGAGGAAVVLFLTGPYNEAAIRAISTPETKSPQSLERYIEQWLETRRAEFEDQPGKYTVIVAAAEGGGIRAGYWAGTVLAALHDRDPCTTDHMLAISAVSGGSIGAGVYTAVVATEPRASGPCEADHRVLLPKVQAILGADLLSSQLGAALVSDGIRSALQSNLLPAALRVTHFADRSSVFEVSLEAASRGATGTSILEQSWSRPWSGPYHRDMPPLVIPNMTSVENGERVILTPFSAAHEWPYALDAAKFEDASRLHFSTAIFLSARFPAISPTARLGETPHTLRVVDGGYGDNSGTATARSVGALLMKIAAQKGLAQRIRPVFLILTNGETAASPEKTTWAATPLGTIFDPASTLIGVGTSNSARYRSELSCAIMPWGGEIIDDFKLDYRHARLPLGWMLAPSTREILDARLKELMSLESTARHISALTHDGEASVPAPVACLE